MTAEPSPNWFITGCSSGLGRALAEAALHRGCRVAMTARDPASLATLAAAAPDRGLALPLDVTDPDAIAHAVRRAEARFGGIDVLVNNAGHAYFSAVEDGEEAEIRAVFETGFFGPAALLRAVLPGMRARGRGHVVNITSMGALVGIPGAGYYSAVKFAMRGLSEALAPEVAPFGIRVTTVAPAAMRTDFAGRSLRVTRAPLAAYDATAGARARRSQAGHGSEAVDPARAAAAILDAVSAPSPPALLLLGGNAPEVARARLRTLLGEVETGSAIAAGADFPTPEAAG
ncbi:MAG TPA: oxidoreductase [Acetobacteraceae bacterium]|nr:oxidoreductase [Acetobacteraceae bacterium]